MDNGKILSIIRLREVLDYNPKTGIFIWKVVRHNGNNIGDIAGYTHSRGYVIISVDGNQYKAHRLAWFYVKGKWRWDFHGEFARY